MTALFANDVRHNNPGFVLSRGLVIWKHLSIKGFLVVNQARLNICVAIRVKMHRGLEGRKPSPNQYSGKQ
jgi:hypothetical protein